MKPKFTHTDPKRLARHKRRGFALVVTLSLMILLTIIAVGLLSLSSVSLRAANQNNAMSLAKANARMALMLALGDLQKLAGPDQRITARADILSDKTANPNLAGVWQSWDIRAGSPPSASDYEKSSRDRKFLGWLSSSDDGKAQSMVEFADQTTKNPAELWGKGTLGNNSDPRTWVNATLVKLTQKNPGAFAWAVSDEGLKVRVNTPQMSNPEVKSQQVAQLGSGVRPNAASIKALEGLKDSMFEYGSDSFATLEKGVTRLNFAHAANTLNKGAAENLKPLAHDVTSHSVGLFTDVATGGIKEDFNLMTNGSSLPSQYAGKGVYTSRLGTTGPSDPRWEGLQQLARYYKVSGGLSNTGGMPLARATVPSGWRAASGSDPNSGTVGATNRNPPTGLILMPTIAKVQVVFSLLTRDIYNYPKVSDTTPKQNQTKAEETSAMLHSPWGANFAGSSYDYLLHLLYTPVVTVHNPYNVALEFTDLKVVFGNVPFALQVFRNGQPMTNGPAPLDTMFYQQSETGNLAKRFGMTLKTNGGTPTTPSVGSPTFRLLPGEVIMFSPYIDPNQTWASQYQQRTFSDWDTGSGATRTMVIDGLPGWRGDGIGFDLDWFCPTYKGLRVSDKEVENGVSMGRGGCLGAKATDEFSVKFAPLNVDTLSKNKFTVEIFARPAGTSSQVSSGIIELDYETPTGLQNQLLGKDGMITYPKTGTINAMAMHSHSQTKIKDINTAKPFAIISAQAKTTYGGLNPDGEDGKLATKPWCFAHSVIGASSGKIVTEHPANHSHEIALQRLDNGTNNLLQFDPKTGRGNFITGQTGNTGLKFGALYDVPLGPLQNFSQLNTANPGGSSGYLPRFAHPIGNSWAHPVLDPSRVKTPSSNGELLDHSFLLNLALYDHFYFSGIADQTGPYGSTSRSSAKIAEDFLNGIPLSDPRLTLRAPDGRPRADFTKEITASDAYSKVAAWQTINGPFNINSTSVTAWKAMLGSIRDANSLYNSINKSTNKSAFASLPAVDSGKNESRISRFRLPASLSEADGGDPSESYWLGAREFNDDELQRLAEEIVKQVRARGPFLSMSEFVNRRLGTGDMAQKGALQQAIDNANLNTSLANSSSAGFDIPSSTVSNYKYRNAEAGTGPSYQGAPGYLTQADVLGVLGNAATPRSDTFTIRAYGEARDAAGKPIAKAWCEAVVQRLPEFVDSKDKVETPVASLESKINKTFGRRFTISSFRWLTSGEI